MVVYHHKKHDINDSKDHVRNELELNDYLMLQENKYLWYGGNNFLAPSNMDDWSDSLTNWTGSGLSLDSSDKIEGSNSIIVNATGTQTYKYTYSSAVDLTDAGVLHWWAKRVSKNATINYIRFYTDATNYYEITPNTSYGFTDWYETAFNKTDFTAVGSPDWSNIAYFELNQTNGVPAGIVKWDKIYWSASRGWVGNANVDVTTLSGNLSITGYTAGTFIGDGSNLTDVTPDMQDNQWFYMNTADNKGIQWNSVYNAVTTSSYTDWYLYYSNSFWDTDYALFFDGILGSGNVYQYYDSGQYLVVNASNTGDQVYLYGEGTAGSKEGVYLESGAGITLYTNTDKINLSGVSTIGDGGATNYTQFSADGLQTMHGDARVTNSLEHYAYDIGAIAGTYNSISCDAANSSSINGVYLRTFCDGSGFGNNPEAINLSFRLPAEYDAGTDIELIFSASVGGTSTNVVRWQAGWINIADGDTLSPNTYTWGTPNNWTPPGTAWEMTDLSYTISGTGIAPNDVINIVIFRDADNGADNYSGDSYINSVKIEYDIDRLGGAI